MQNQPWPLGNLTPEEFLKDYWQKRPLLIRNAISDFVCPLSGDELAGMACEEEIESRLVIGQGAQWELKNGPFDADDFAALPSSKWTLLVQAVDHWEPEVRSLLEPFRFIPDWRLDDIMISYAVDGGGVGPHYDNYDVFLLQGQGQRSWKIGQQCDDNSPLIDHSQLRLLANFDEQDGWVLNPGDMLYLPPCLAHLGEAVGNDCITLSIGFRAPSHGDILREFSEFAAHSLPESRRYSDPDIKMQNSSGEINATAVEKVQNILLEAVKSPERVAQWFGQYMTQPKYPDQLEETAHFYGSTLSAGARLAWHQTKDGGIILYANGESRLLSGHLEAAVRKLCETRMVDSEIQAALGEEITHWLEEVEAYFPG